MQEGEVLAVVEEDKGDGWTRVRRNNGDEGYIPTSYVTISLNEWRMRGKRGEEMITSPNCIQFFQWDQSKRSHSTIGRTDWCIQKGIQISCFDFLREVPEMGRGMVLTVCPMRLTLHYCNPSNPRRLNHKIILPFDIMLRWFFWFRLKSVAWVIMVRVFALFHCLIRNYLLNVRGRRRRRDGRGRWVLLPSLHRVFIPVILVYLFENWPTAVKLHCSTYNTWPVAVPHLLALVKMNGTVTLLMVGLDVLNVPRGVSEVWGEVASLSALSSGTQPYKHFNVQTITSISPFLSDYSNNKDIAVVF